MGKRFFATAKQWATLMLVAGMGLGGMSGAAQATLEARYLDGSATINAYYDTVLHITWLQNAFLASTNNFGQVACDPGVLQSWTCAEAWIAAMNAADYLGYSDWRMPYASVSAGAGPIQTLTVGFPCNGSGGADEVSCRDDEMAYMFYYDLGGVQGMSIATTHNSNYSDFANIQTVRNFSGTEYQAGFSVWFFTFGSVPMGFAQQFNESEQVSAGGPWVVRPGDVAAAPEPASLALLSLGLAGLAFSRRKKA